MITPIQGRVLVELKGEYEHIEATEERFGTAKTRGRVLGVAADITPAKLKTIGCSKLAEGMMVYFGKYEDSTSLKLPNGKPGALIKLEEIGGVE